MEPASQRESQFHTQAARLVESQSNGEEVEEETSVERVLEWDATPPPEHEVPGPLEDVRTEGGYVEPEAGDPIEWESSPERPKKTKTVSDFYNYD
jgi:hypothetical protein